MFAQLVSLPATNPWRCRAHQFSRIRLLKGSNSSKELLFTPCVKKGFNLNFIIIFIFCEKCHKLLSLPVFEGKETKAKKSCVILSHFLCLFDIWRHCHLPVIYFIMFSDLFSRLPWMHILRTLWQLHCWEKDDKYAQFASDHLRFTMKKSHFRNHFALFRLQKKHAGNFKNA